MYIPAQSDPSAIPSYIAPDESPTKEPFPPSSTTVSAVTVAGFTSYTHTDVFPVLVSSTATATAIVSGSALPSSSLVAGTLQQQQQQQQQQQVKPWYSEANWLGPVSWGLAFYCVLSLLVLGVMYGQGIVDGKLNYIQNRRHGRQLRHRDSHNHHQGDGNDQLTTLYVMAADDWDGDGTAASAIRPQMQLQLQSLSNRLEAEKLERALIAAGF